METTQREPRTLRRGRAARWAVVLPPLAVALGALWIGRLTLVAGPLLVAMVAGALVANTPLSRHPSVQGHQPATRVLLRLGIGLLGLQISVGDLAGVGPEGLGIAVAVVALTFVGTVVVGRLLGLERDLVMLIAAGFSICGAAAIAAFNDVVRARERDVAVAVVLVTVFGTGMIALAPAVVSVAGLDTDQAAIWAGASIHEVAQVVVTASLVAPGALALAMTIKLGRVLLLAPMLAVAAHRGADGRAAGEVETRRPVLPWFVALFVAMVALRSTGVLPSPLLEAVGMVATVSLAAGMYGLGLGLAVAELRGTPMRAVLLATIATLVAGVSSLGLILLLL